MTRPLLGILAKLIGRRRPVIGAVLTRMAASGEYTPTTGMTETIINVVGHGGRAAEASGGLVQQTSLPQQEKPPMFSNIKAMMSGKKTYALMALGVVVIVANHFGITLPGVQLDPANWIQDIFLMLSGASVRAAIAKV